MKREVVIDGNRINLIQMYDDLTSIFCNDWYNKSDEVVNHALKARAELQKLRLSLARASVVVSGDPRDLEKDGL